MSAFFSQRSSLPTTEQLFKIIISKPQSQFLDPSSHLMVNSVIKLSNSFQNIAARNLTLSKCHLPYFPAIGEQPSHISIRMQNSQSHDMENKGIDIIENIPYDINKQGFYYNIQMPFPFTIENQDSIFLNITLTTQIGNNIFSDVTFPQLLNLPRDVNQNLITAGKFGNLNMEFILKLISFI